MNLAYPVHADKRDKIPAPTHVDGTGRLQTVTREANPRYHALISEFARQTGVPVVLNTSFNDNEPIVCRPKKPWIVSCELRWTHSYSATSSSRVHESAHPAAKVAAKILRELLRKMLAGCTSLSRRYRPFHLQRNFGRMQQRVVHQAVLHRLFQSLAMFLRQLDRRVHFDHEIGHSRHRVLHFSQVTRTRVPSVASLFLRRYCAA